MTASSKPVAQAAPGVRPPRAHGAATAPPPRSGSADPEVCRTPLVSIRVTIAGAPRRVRLKLEGCNPAGSAKYRTARALVADLDRRGLLRPDSVVLESTSGNLGVALAQICRARGVGFLAIVDPKATQENLEKMKELGAEIETVREPDEVGGFLMSRLTRVQELRRLSPRYVWTNQYSNWANPAVHYVETGAEILEQCGAPPDAVFVPVSTGGTLAGIGRCFRENSRSTLVVGVDAVGSVIFGGPPGVRKLTGIGASRRSDFLSPNHYDAHVLVSDAEAFLFCRELWARTGHKLGGSSGAAVAACVRFLRERPRLRDAVCVCPDGGENYESTIYDDAWLRHAGVVCDASEFPEVGVWEESS